MANADPNHDAIMASYRFCFNQYYTLAEMVTFMGAKHGVDEKNVFAVYVQVTGFNVDYEKNAKINCAGRQELIAKYEWCFQHFFTVSEVVKLMQSEYGQEEENVTRYFGSLLKIKKAGAEYHAEAERRCAQRQKRAQKNKRLKEEKKVRERDPLFEALSKNDKETVRYLMNYAQANPLPIVEEAHEEERVDCSCFQCYCRFWTRYIESEHHTEMNRIMESLDSSTEEDPVIAQARSAEQAFQISCAEISSFWF